MYKSIKNKIKQLMLASSICVTNCFASSAFPQLDGAKEIADGSKSGLSYFANFFSIAMLILLSGSVIYLLYNGIFMIANSLKYQKADDATISGFITQLVMGVTATCIGLVLAWIGTEVFIWYKTEVANIGG